MKLNMGCGHNKRPGYVNVDLFPECSPDLVCDLEVLPWPWGDNSVDAVMFNHSLEHLGQSSKVFLGMMKELYRVCRDGAEIEINVPHPRHDNFINDPTHVRIITPSLLNLFNREMNDEWKRIGAANSPMAHYLGVDFKVVRSTAVLSDPYSTQFDNGELSDATIQVIGRELNNVFQEFRIVMVARKSS
jgi:hypothetical protein